MSTSGAVGVFCNGKLFVSYVHWDSYPSSLGQKVVDFCKELTDKRIDILKQKFNSINMVDLEDKADKESQKKYSDAGFFDDNIADGNPSNWYCLLRNIQGIKYLEAVLDGSCSHWIDMSAFLKQSLQCEYAYIINLDNGTLEFYKGFNKAPDTKSYLPFEQKKDSSGYYPVRFKGSVSIKEILDNWIDKFYSLKKSKVC